MVYDKRESCKGYIKEEISMPRTKTTKAAVTKTTKAAAKRFKKTGTGKNQCRGRISRRNYKKRKHQSNRKTHQRSDYCTVQV